MPYKVLVSLNIPSRAEQLRSHHRVNVLTEVSSETAVTARHPNTVVYRDSEDAAYSCIMIDDLAGEATKHDQLTERISMRGK